MQRKTCSNCSVDIYCGSMEENCWCMGYDSLVNISKGKDCLCELCLKEAIKKTINASNETSAVEEDYYIDNGLYVFTRSYHLKRGTCCKNGCRHCPYE